MTQHENNPGGKAVLCCDSECVSGLRQPWSLSGQLSKREDKLAVIQLAARIFL